MKKSYEELTYDFIDETELKKLKLREIVKNIESIKSTGINNSNVKQFILDGQSLNKMMSDITTGAFYIKQMRIYSQMYSEIIEESHPNMPDDMKEDVHDKLMKRTFESLDEYTGMEKLERFITRAKMIQMEMLSGDMRVNLND